MSASQPGRRPKPIRPVAWQATQRSPVTRAILATASRSLWTSFLAADGIGVGGSAAFGNGAGGVIFTAPVADPIATSAIVAVVDGRLPAGGAS